MEDEGPTGGMQTLANLTNAAKKRKKNNGPKNPANKPIKLKQPTIGKRLMQLESQDSFQMALESKS